MKEETVYAIERPHKKLLTYYLIRSFTLPPLSFIGLPFLFFRYKTMRYKFDDEGITMSWGILFRHQINLTYRRIQDIHLTSGIIQRWLGLADIHIQTASGSSAAEMTIEGLLEFEDIRDFLYSKMRGYHAHKDAKKVTAPSTSVMAASSEELVQVLREISQEVKMAREAIERRGEEGGAHHV